MKKIFLVLVVGLLMSACAEQTLAPNFEQASWIGINMPDSVLYDADDHAVVPAVYLEKKIKLEEEVEQVMLYVSTMGFAEYYLNGEKIGDDAFGNLPTQYDKTIYYLQYDITDKWQVTANTFSAQLTAGYAVGMQKGMAIFGVPRMIASIAIKTKNDVINILTDTTWQATDKGAIRVSNLYDGELYDAHLANASEWINADVLPAPAGQLLPQPAPSMAVMDTIKAKSVRQLENGHVLVDMGINMVGWLELRAEGKEGQSVIMRFAELLQADSSTIYTDNLRDAYCTNIYIPSHDGVFTYAPTSVYQGFRYVDIEGLENVPGSEDCIGLFIYDRMADAGTFECSNPLLNQLHQAAYNGIRSNYKGMPTDCPQRDERLGWLGDRFTGAYGETFLFNNHDTYLKWLQDIEDTQDSTGQVSHVAPAYWLRLRSANTTWCGTYISIAYMLYERYGDESGFRKHYPSMRRWIQFIINNVYDNGIVTRDTYGDWCMPPERQELIHSKDPSRITEAALLSTAVFYQLLGEMQVFADRMNLKEDVHKYTTLREQVKDAFNNRFYNQEEGYYGNNTVTANILAYSLGLADESNKERVMEHIVDVTTNRFDSHVSVGVVGIQHLMRTLTRNGQADLAYTIATQTSYPSWGYMLTHGATTIWELWNGDTANPAMNSANHVMLLGDVLLWMYEDLAGIRPMSNIDINGEKAYKEIYMQPYFAPELSYVKASYPSVNGAISSYWQRDDEGRIMWQVNLPKGVKATVVLPDKTRKTYSSSFQLTF